MLTPTRFLDACHRRCGDYFTLRPAPDREIVFTVDPAAVEKVFKGDPNLLYAGEGNISLAPILGPGSVLLLDGPEHLRHRRLLLPPFHGERMREYGEVMTEVAEPSHRRLAARRALPRAAEHAGDHPRDHHARGLRLRGPSPARADRRPAAAPPRHREQPPAGPRAGTDGGAQRPAEPVAAVRRRPGGGRRAAPRGDPSPPGGPARRRGRRHLLDAARGARPGRRAADRRRAARRADDAARRRSRDDGDRPVVDARAADPHAGGARHGAARSSGRAGPSTWTR